LLPDDLAVIIILGGGGLEKKIDAWEGSVMGIRL
jgi:hypothetical protein